MKRDRAVVILSGGIDSAAVLYQIKSEGWDPLALSFQYRQRHGVETRAARIIASSAEVPLEIVDLSGWTDALRRVGASTVLLDPDAPMPHGHYSDSTMEATVVPGRNGVFLSVGISVAGAIGAKAVFYGAHSGDHEIYPDCRPRFVDGMKLAAEVQGITLDAPLLMLNKSEIVETAAALRVPLEFTWTCYDPSPSGETFLHCGKCGSCVERREAFELSGVPDCTVWADR